MALKFAVLSVILAVASAGHLGAQLTYSADYGHAPVAYTTGYLAAAPGTYSAPITAYAKEYASPIAYSAAPAYSYSAAPLVAKAITAPIVSKAITAPIATYSSGHYAAPVASYSSGYATPIATYSSGHYSAPIASHYSAPAYATYTAPTVAKSFTAPVSGYGAPNVAKSYAAPVTTSYSTFTKAIAPVATYATTAPALIYTKAVTAPLSYGTGQLSYGTGHLGYAAGHYSAYAAPVLAKSFAAPVAHVAIGYSGHHGW